jgi:dolichol-phosphate mannosyltransferase
VTPQVSIVVPAYQEGAGILPTLDALRRNVRTPAEILVVVDFAEDSTVAAVEPVSAQDDRVTVLINTYGRGPAQAIRYGIDHASAPVVVVTMADGSDDSRQVDEMVQAVWNGAVLVAASRYMPGGRQEGGPPLKRLMSRGAGLSLHHLVRVPIHDPTSAFKAYDRSWVQTVGIESRHGFEMAIELTVKAHRAGQPMAQVPTVWRDRTHGESQFKAADWMPHYLHWYRQAFRWPSRGAVRHA